MMFCPNCGADCKDANFCPECGADLRAFKTPAATPQAVAAEEVAEKQKEKIFIPVGKYEGTLGYIELSETALTIHKKILFKTVETTIELCDIANVGYQKAAGLSGGFISVRDRQNCAWPLATSTNAASDKTSLSFVAGANEPMYLVYQCLQAFAAQNHIECAVVQEGEIPQRAQAFEADSVAAASGSGGAAIDMDAYFARFNPDKVAAIKAITRETGIDLRQAKALVDAGFAARQKQLYAADPNAAMRDVKRALAPKKAAHDERKEELDASGQAYCPKCLSTSISADKKGFGIGKAVVGASLTGGLGLMAGNLNAKKVRCTCLKCGYQWMAGKK